MEYQKTFIDIILTHVPDGEKLVDFIADMIHIGKEASYRRIRCEVEFSLSEIVIIAKRLNINLNSIVISEGGLKTVFNMRFPDDQDPATRFLKRKKGDLFFLEGFFTGKCFMYCANCYIPDELTYDSPALTKLKLMKYGFVSGGKNIIPLGKITIPHFVTEIQQKYLERLSTIKLIYILEQNLFQAVVSDILFFSHLNLISSQERALLKSELIGVLDTIDSIASTGKYKGKEITIYAAHVAFQLTQAFIKDDGLKASLTELYPPNSLLSFDPDMCQNQEDQINMMKKYSSLITLSGEINKVAFLERQRQYIHLL